MRCTSSVACLSRISLSKAYQAVLLLLGGLKVVSVLAAESQLLCSLSPWTLLASPTPLKEHLSNVSDCFALLGVWSGVGPLLYKHLRGPLLERGAKAILRAGRSIADELHQVAKQEKVPCYAMPHLNQCSQWSIAISKFKPDLQYTSLYAQTSVQELYRLE